MPQISEIKNKKYFLLICAAVFLFAFVQKSCKKDEPLEEPLVFITPSALYIYASIDNVVSFTVDVGTGAPLVRLLITSQPENGFSQTNLDSALNKVTDLSFTYQYKVPASLAGLSSVFTFTAYDENGKSGAAARRLVVYPLPATKPRLLSETTGHQMFSSKSTNANAYDLESTAPQQKFSTISDSTFRDVQDNTLPTDTTMALSRSWISPAGGKFVNFSGFDYGNATDSLLISAYNSGSKLEQLSNIQQNDIILMKLGSTANNAEIYVAIKVMTINDADSTKNDYYTFNLKK